MPDTFEDMATGTRFFACSICGVSTPGDGLVSDH
jgi:hypothetical protein